MSERVIRPDCPLCGCIEADEPNSTVEAGDPDFLFNKILFRREDCVVVPALGMFVPGYLLVVARTHIRSFAALDAANLGEIDRWISSILDRLAPVFGEYVGFEHGQGLHPASRAGNCIDHAHIHLLPVRNLVESHLLSLLNWRVLPTFQDLAAQAETSYAYLGLKDRHYLVIEPSIPSQWIRRQVAEGLNLDTWDWAVYAGRNELEATLRGLKTETAVGES